MRTAVIALLLLLSIVIGSVAAQRGGMRGGRGWRENRYPDRSEFPTWPLPDGHEKDVFTFARVKYTPHYFRGWDADYPDADWNLSLRLQQLTTLKVNPNSVLVHLTDPELFEYPFIFLSAPYSIIFTDEEARSLRRYLHNGGFMMCDEFWGTVQWAHFYTQMKRVLPECEPRELTLDHEIFHNVYDFKELPQATAIHFWQQGYTYHPVVGTEHDHSPHFFGLFDKADPATTMICAMAGSAKAKIASSLNDSQSNVLFPWVSTSSPMR